MIANSVEIKLIPHPETNVKTETGGSMTLEIAYSYTFLYSEPTPNGLVNGYVPLLDLYFYSRPDEMDKVSNGVCKAFLLHFVNQEGFPALARQLKVLGFMTTGGITEFRKLLNRRLFTSPITFKYYPKQRTHTGSKAMEGAKERHVTQKLELAY